MPVDILYSRRNRAWLFRSTPRRKNTLNYLYLLNKYCFTKQPLEKSCKFNTALLLVQQNFLLIVLLYKLA